MSAYAMAYPVTTFLIVLIIAITIDSVARSVAIAIAGRRSTAPKKGG